MEKKKNEEQKAKCLAMSTLSPGADFTCRTTCAAAEEIPHVASK